MNLTVCSHQVFVTHIQECLVNGLFVMAVCDFVDVQLISGRTLTFCISINPHTSFEDLFLQVMELFTDLFSVLKATARGSIHGTYT